MATGITKREQQSLDAISALGFDPDHTPLPAEKALAELSYPQKAARHEITTAVSREYLAVSRNLSAALSALERDSFVLDDNFFFLNQLRQTGRRATLIYLDPPYGTGFDFHSRDLKHAYKDKMGQAAYLEFMRRRLILMRDCLTEDGSIYLHIGHQMLFHLKVLLDEVFGSENFRNLITRRKCSSKNFTSRQYANINDYILFYSKSRNYKWNQPGYAAEDEWVAREYPKFDALGRRYKLVPIHAPGTRNGETGLPWRNMVPPPGKHWQYPPAKLEQLDQDGDIHWSKTGNPRRKVYWTSTKMRSLTDYWDQYRDAHHQSIQITGYPTEKNLDMLTMIVGASSDPGDLVIDPFCGSGTTLQAARDLGRRFIGVDASFAAATATLKRLRHGAEAMGDYVNKKRRDVQISLSLEASAVSDCALVVDRRLLHAYQEEIEQIACV